MNNGVAKSNLFFYIQNMNDIFDKNTRILNITHYDMDGICSHIILKNYYSEVILVPITYQSEKTLTEKVKEHEGEYDAIICSDFHPEQTYTFLKKLGKPMIVMDHHESVANWHNGLDIIVDTSQSASRQLLQRYGKLCDLSHLNDLVAIVDDFDMYRKQDRRSPEFNKLFWEMGMKWWLHRFQNGNTKLYPEEIEWIKESFKQVDKVYDKLAITELPGHGVFFELDYYQFEITEKLRKDGYKWFMILNKKNLSIRSDESIDLLPIIKKINRGGGHHQAVGIPLNYKEDVGYLVKKIIKAFNEIYTDHNITI